jgi:hypothetical protein
LHQAVERAIERATLDRRGHLAETGEATRDLVAHARALRRC